MKKYKTILIDPPWEQGKTGKRKVRPKQNTKLDYPTMNISEIQALPISKLIDKNCLLFLWTTDRFMEEAHQIIRNWGFKKHCIFVWNKNTGVCPFSVQFKNEYMLMGYVGKLQLRKIGVPTNFFAKVTKHSEKPEESYQLIESISESPYLELFARKKRQTLTTKWDVWGNEVKSDIDLEELKKELKV